MEGGVAPFFSNPGPWHTVAAKKLGVVIILKRRVAPS